MPAKFSGWMRRKGSSAVCESCLKDVSLKPGLKCLQPEHARYHRKRKIYREQEKIAAKNRWRNRLKVLAMLGGKCCRCGEDDPRVLQINHLKGGGTQERKRAGLSGFSIIRDILMGRRGLDDLDLRCANCNIIYEYEVGRRKFIDC